MKMKMNSSASAFVLSILSSCLIVNSGSAMATEHKEANFTATITADVPNDFKMLTKDGNQDNINLTFPDSAFNGADNVFNDQFKAVKIIGTAVGSDTSVTMRADNLTLTSDDGKTTDMIVMFADDKGKEPTVDDVSDDMVISDTTQNVTLDKTNIATFSSFYVGYNLNGLAVAPGKYTGTIILTAAAEL